MTEKPAPFHTLVAHFTDHPVYKPFCEYAESQIRNETEKILTVDKPMRDAQIDKAAHYKEFWDGMMVYIKNAQNHPNK